MEALSEAESWILRPRILDCHLLREDRKRYLLEASFKLSTRSLLPLWISASCANSENLLSAFELSTSHPHFEGVILSETASHK